MSEQVLEALSKAIIRKANGIISDVETIKDHPTYTTKTAIREELHEMKGLIQGYLLVAQSLGVSNPPLDETRVPKAYSAVRELDTFKAGRRTR